MIQDSRLDDELSVATIEFRDTPKWLSQDPYGFPKFTPLGTLWRAVDWNAVDEHGRTEFIRAVMKIAGFSKMGLCYAEMLAEFPETDVNVQDDKGRTALHWACVASHADMVMLCLSVPECRIGLKDNDGLTAFDISLRSSSGNDAIPNLFYQSMFDMEEIQPQAALLRALTVTSEPATGRDVFPGAVMFPSIEDSNEELVEALIIRGVELTATNRDGDTALHVAAAKVDNVAITTRLLNAGSDVNAIGNGGATPLHYAVDTGDVGMVQLLLHHDADQSIADDSQRTPLIRAENDQKQDLVLLLKGPETNSRMPIDELANSDVGFSQPTIVQHEAHVQVPSSDMELSNMELSAMGKISLMEAVRIGNLEIVRLWLRSGADLGAGLGSSTPLHVAAIRGHRAIALLLVAAGAEIDSRTIQNLTPLHLALHFRQPEVAIALINSGANVNALGIFGHTPLHEAARSGHMEVVKLLLASKVSVEGLDLFGQTALLHAAQNGHPDVVQTLITFGAGVDATSSKKQSALYQAATNGFTDVVKVLIANGANLEVRNASGETALHRAAENGHTDVVEVLLTNGADLNALCTLKDTPLKKALLSGKRGTIEALEKAGTRSPISDFLMPVLRRAKRL